MTTKKINFFLIDDSEVNNYYNEDLLKEFEFTESVTIFNRAKEALERIIDDLKQNKPSPEVIFLDIRMPEMDGFEFIEDLETELDELELELDSRIFILTSSMHRRDFEAFDKQQIACEFLNKPLEKNEIEQIIQKYFS
jgi:CheY-like chemotaxis protein